MPHDGEEAGDRPVAVMCRTPRTKTLTGPISPARLRIAAGSAPSTTRYETPGCPADSASAGRTALAATSIPTTTGNLPASSRVNRPLPQPR